MNYFLVGNSSELVEVGSYPQVNTHHGDYNPGSPEGYWAVKFDSFPNFTPKIELKLDKKAIFTNCISTIIPFGFVVDEITKNVLSQHKLPKHKFYSINIYKDDICFKYYWFHYVIDDFWNHLDREKSKAVVLDSKKEFKSVAEIDLMLPKQKIVELSSTTLPYHQNIVWEKIVFKSSLPSYDFYGTLDNQFLDLASEKLINAIKNEGITGFTFGSLVKAYCPDI